jgi:hypothetical protein
MPNMSIFRDLDDVKRERGRLMTERDLRGAALQRHREHITDKRFRKKLIGNTISELLRAWKPMRHFGESLGPASGVAGGILGMLLGSRMESRLGRWVLTGLGAVLPALGEKLHVGERGGHIASELGHSWERIKDYVRDRRTARRN